MEKNILIVGVGGQGTLLASVLLGNLALQKGYDVKLSEVHGMSQRGGDVVTHVKINDTIVASPLIEKGEADIIIAFEKLEAYRWLPYLREGGAMYVNEQQIMPMPVVLGQVEYPSDIDEALAKAASTLVKFDALALAEEAGSSKAVNIVLMGRLSHYFDLPDDAWQKSMEAIVPAKFLELNKKAFALGKNA
jgi:Pyruvate:ferredoxin oxidoreductase and related 2-oxoacid:ferredoxin oxidoreductases, gamma subunit